jgi:uncharacterized protein YbjT (DUF2867 family)
MDVAIAGGHGKIALRLGKMLSSEGSRVRGLIRDAGQAEDLLAAGVEPTLCDLEGPDDVAAAIRGAEAVVFAAGAGPGSGAERKRSMDLGGALKLIEAARLEDVGRYVIVSAMGAAHPPPSDNGDVFAAYLRAKAEADRALKASGLDYTIVRPGRLTDEEPTGAVSIGKELRRGEISRADVAAVLAAVLTAPNAAGKTFDVVAGGTSIEEAVAGL